MEDLRLWYIHVSDLDVALSRPIRHLLSLVLVPTCDVVAAFDEFLE